MDSSAFNDAMHHAFTTRMAHLCILYIIFLIVMQGEYVTKG